MSVSQFRDKLTITNEFDKFDNRNCDNASCTSAQCCELRVSPLKSGFNWWTTEEKHIWMPASGYPVYLKKFNKLNCLKLQFLNDYLQTNCWTFWLYFTYFWLYLRWFYICFGYKRTDLCYRKSKAHRIQLHIPYHFQILSATPNACAQSINRVINRLLGH